jgi:NADPH:quinone reductase-like Zn-dependent oxidoreductase
MRGVRVGQFGPPQVLVPAEFPEPVPQPGQAPIQVEFASISFVDTQIRAGAPPNPAMVPKLPVVPGNGVGGRMIGLGPGLAGAVPGGVGVDGALLGGPGLAQAPLDVAGGLLGVAGVAGGRGRQGPLGATGVTGVCLVRAWWPARVARAATPNASRWPRTH